MAIRSEQVTGLVLAGGRGSRMGGIDKGLQLFCGEPMAGIALRRLQPQVGALMISANRHLDDYRAFGVPVVSDHVGGYAGPLAGLHAGLAQCRSDYLVTVPCDSPRFPADLVARLADALCAADAQAAVAVTEDDQQPRRHPVFCLVRRDMLPSLQAWLDSGGRKFDGWLDSLHCASAAFKDALAFTNLNTPDELAALARRR